MEIKMSQSPYISAKEMENIPWSAFSHCWEGLWPMVLMNADYREIIPSAEERTALWWID